MTDKDKNEVPKIEIKKPTSTGDDKTAKIPKPLSSATGDDKKVVLNSGTDSAIRPSDATRMAPAAVPPPSGLEETVQMDQSDVKDVPVVAKPPSATVDDSTQKTAPPLPPISQDAKSKTIKLKPLQPIAEDNNNQEETLSMERDALLNKEMPSSLGATQQQEKAIDDEATIKIQKPGTTNKPAHPTPSIPGAKETIKLRPSNATPPPAAPAADATQQDSPAMSKKTIRLVPKAPGGDDATQKTARPSAPTVKLTDSKAPAAPAVVAPAPAPAPAAAAPPPAAVPPTAAKPSAPTVKLPGAATAPATGKKTLKLKSSAKTIVVPPEAPKTGGGPAAPPSNEGTESDMPKAKGKKGKKGKKAKKEKNTDQKANPGSVFTIAAVFAFMLMVYYTWMIAGQWAELHKEVKSASVPGCSEKVKPSQ